MSASHSAHSAHSDSSVSEFVLDPTKWSYTKYMDWIDSNYTIDNSHVTNLFIDCEGDIINLDQIDKFINLEIVELHDSANESLSEVFGNLTKLRKVTIEDTDIRVLPESFGNLINLTELTITGNRIETLPNTFGNLIKLVKLKLSFEPRLTDLPDSFGNLVNLVELQLMGNTYLTSLPESFGNLTKLTELYLSGDTSLRTLPNSFRNLINLNILHIPLTANSIPENIRNLPGITIRAANLARPRPHIQPVQNNNEVDAYQVHDAFAKLDIPRYLGLLAGYTLKPSDIKPNIYATVVDFFNHLTKLDVTGKRNETLKNNRKQSQRTIRQKFMALKQKQKARLDEVLTRLKNAHSYNVDPEFISLIRPTIAFLKKQSSPFQRNYIQTYIQDTYYAYDDEEDTISCVKGILERMVFSIGNATLMACPSLSKCSNPLFKQLLNLFYGLTEESEGIVMLSHWQFTNEFTTWVNSDESNKTKTVEQLQTMYKDFLWAKYKEANPHTNFGLVSQELRDQIQDLINKETAELTELNLFILRDQEFYAGKPKRKIRQKQTTRKIKRNKQTS